MGELQPLIEGMRENNALLLIVGLLLLIREVRALMEMVLKYLSNKKNGGNGNHWKIDNQELILALNSLKDHLKDWIEQLHRGREAAAKSIEAHFPRIMDRLDQIEGKIK